MNASAREGRPITAYSRMAAIGLLLIGAVFLVYLVAGTLSRAEGQGIGEGAAFIVPFAALMIVPAILLWRFGGWANILGLLAVVAALMGAFWLVFGLLAPASFLDFLGGVAWIVGIVLALGGSVAGLVAWRRRNLTPRAAGLERRIINVALGIVGVAAAVSLLLNLFTRESVSETAAQGAHTVIAKGFEFDEQSYEFASGAEVKVLVRNEDPFNHTFTIPELDIDEPLIAGEEKLITIRNPRPGTYVLYCTPHSNTEDPTPEEDEMAARIVVT